MGFLKQGEVEGTKKGRGRKKASEEKHAEPMRVILEHNPDEIAPTVDSIGYLGLSEIAEHMGTLSRIARDYANNTYSGENSLHIFTGPSGSGYHPVLIALEPSDTIEDIIEVMGRVATAFERIADVLTGTHKAENTQSEQTANACDGGAGVKS